MNEDDKSKVVELKRDIVPKLIIIAGLCKEDKEQINRIESKLDFVMKNFYYKQQIGNRRESRLSESYKTIWEKYQDEIKEDDKL